MNSNNTYWQNAHTSRTKQRFHCDSYPATWLSMKTLKCFEECDERGEKLYFFAVYKYGVYVTSMKGYCINYNASSMWEGMTVWRA